MEVPVPVPLLLCLSRRAPLLHLHSLANLLLLFTYSPSLVHSSFLSFVLQLFIGRRRQHHIVLHFCQSCLPAGSSLFYKKLLNLESCLHQARVIRFVTVYCFNDLVPLYTTTNITAARSIAFARWLLALSSLVILEITVPNICFDASRDTWTKTISDSFDYRIKLETIILDACQPSTDIVNRTTA